MFVASFEKGASETDAIIGGPPNPEQDNEENVINVFVSRVIDPDNPFKTSVCLTPLVKKQVICKSTLIEIFLLQVIHV